MTPIERQILKNQIAIVATLLLTLEPSPDPKVMSMATALLKCEIETGDLLKGAA